MEKYEATQNLNAVTRYLHSFRFRKLLDVFAEVAREIPDRPIEVLELGCGVGKAYATLNEHFNIRCCGVDLDAEMIAAARARHPRHERCAFVCADAANPDFYRPNSADIVFALETSSIYLSTSSSGSSRTWRTSCGRASSSSRYRSRSDPPSRSSS